MTRLLRDSCHCPDASQASWQSIFYIAFEGLVFRPANPAHLKVRTTNTST